VESLKQDFERLSNAKETEKNLLSRRSVIIDKNSILLREAGTIMGKSFKSLNDFKAELSGLSEINKTILPDDNAGLTFDDDIEETQKQIERVKLEITALDTRMEQVPSEGELVKVMEELALLKDKKDKYELAGSSLILARQVLNDAAAKLQQDYVPALNNEISKMMSLMTSGRYEMIRTNDKLQINLEVPETDELISVSRLSGGTIDQVYFCMRIAAVLILERNREILPLFLDEPFSQYDENRVLKAFQLLKEISEKHQVFFFTCRARESELAKAVFGENMSLIHF
jgi:uncharacterized protein YhaN